MWATRTPCQNAEVSRATSRANRGRVERRGRGRSEGESHNKEKREDGVERIRGHILQRINYSNSI